MSELFAKRIFVGSAVFLTIAIVFAYGLAVGRYQIWPFPFIQTMTQVAKSYAEYGEWVPEGRRMRAPVGASRETFTIYDKAHVGDGYYVFVGWDDTDKRYAAWLYDQTGKRLHRWPFDYDSLDPDGPLNGGDHPHAFHVMPDGSVIVAFDDGDVMARLDACARPMWIKGGIYHHAMSRADDGSFWVWRAEGTPYGHYQYMHNFDPETGETIKEIGLVEDIIQKSESAAVVFGLRPDYPFRSFERTPFFWGIADLFHANDIDVLSSDLAPKFPMFEAGDLLLSFRTLNLVAVIDPDDRRLKWWSHGPWIGQHDPDFTSDGKISVYNNNTGRGRSDIIKIDPATREISNDLIHGDVSFHTDFMGKHQYLPNGNVLIIVPEEGRALEVTRSGKKVMEFDNLSTNSLEYNEHIENGMWVPRDYFQTFPHCPG